MATSPARRRSGINPLLVVLLLIVAGLGTVGTLHATGKHKFAFIDKLLGHEVHAADHSGMVAIPISSRPLQPGHRIERSDLWDVAKNVPQVVWVPEGSVNENWKRKPSEIEDRVMARDKRPGFTFTEGDFLPPGSQEGAVGLVPKGMRLVSLDPSKVNGIEQLHFQNRFDLVVSEKVDRDLFDQAEKALTRQSGATIDKKLQLASLKEMAHQTVLVHDGMMIQAPAKEAKQREKVVQVAVWPDDVLPLLEALDLERTVVCIPYSGNAAEEVERPLPTQQQPLEKLAWVYDSVQEIEVYNGSERQSVSVPKAK